MLNNSKKVISFTIILISLLILFSCRENPNIEVTITTDDIEILQGAIKAAAIKVLTVDGSKVDEYVVCEIFDYFSIHRFSPTVETKYKFLTDSEEAINKKYFQKKNNRLKELSTSKNSGSVFSVSGFNKNYIIVTYRNFGENHFLNTDDLCSKVSNQETAYLISLKDQQFEVLAESTVLLN